MRHIALGLVGLAITLSPPWAGASRAQDAGTANAPAAASDAPRSQFSFPPLRPQPANAQSGQAIPNVRRQADRTQGLSQPAPIVNAESLRQGNGAAPIQAPPGAAPMNAALGNGAPPNNATLRDMGSAGSQSGNASPTLNQGFRFPPLRSTPRPESLGLPTQSGSQATAVPVTQPPTQPPLPPRRFPFVDPPLRPSHNQPRTDDVPPAPPAANSNGQPRIGAPTVASPGQPSRFSAPPVEQPFRYQLDNEPTWPPRTGLDRTNPDPSPFNHRSAPLGNPHTAQAIPSPQQPPQASPAPARVSDIGEQENNGNAGPPSSERVTGAGDRPEDNAASSAPMPMDSAAAAPVNEPKTGTQGAAELKPQESSAAAAPTDAMPLLDHNELIQVREQVAASTQHSDAMKRKFLEKIDSALAAMRSAENFRGKAEAFRKESQLGPAEIAKLRLELDKSPPPLAGPTSESLAALEARVADLAQSAKDARSDLQNAKQKLEVRAARKVVFAADRKTASEKIQAVQEKIQVLAETELSAETAIAQMDLKAQLQALRAQVEMLEAEKTAMESTAGLLELRLDAAQRRSSRATEAAQAWRTRLDGQRRVEALKLAEEARKAASESHPVLRDLAQANALLAEKRSDLAGKITKAADQIRDIDATAERIGGDFNDVAKRVKVANMSPSIGVLLRNRRAHLPSGDALAQQAAFAATEMQVARLESMEMQQQRQLLADLEQATEAAIAKLDLNDSTLDPQLLKRKVSGLLAARRDTLLNAQTEFDAYLDDLSDLELRANQLLRVIRDYEKFVDENVLWSPSADKIGIADLKASSVAAKSLLQGDQWRAMADDVVANVSAHPTYSLVLLAGCVALFLFRRRMLSRLKTLGEQAQTSLQITHTIEALILTLGLAAFAPSVMWCAGWWLTRNGDGLAGALAIALQHMALGCLIGELFRQICRPNGLAEKHFQWPSSFNSAFFSRLRRLMYIVLPTLFATSFFRIYDGGQWNTSIGRLTLLGGLCLVGCYLHFTLRPNRGALQIALRDAVGGWFARLRYVWYLAGVGLPLTFAALLMAGYAYTVDQLLMRVMLTLGMVFVALIAQALSSRALVVGWLRLANLRRNLAQVRDESPDDDATGESEADSTERICGQLRQFTRAAAVLALCIAGWFTWAGIAPAIQTLNVELWPSTSVNSVEVRLPSGQTELQTRTIKTPIRISHVLTAIVALMTTFVAAKTLPGLLELAMVGRLPIDRGARHAIIIISRYLATLIGVIIACRMIGMTWSSVQWLAAAMTVGLGFGLQEIFANLVSGLIILFERPIRIGDLVTVNGVTGRVTRMQMRATTITDFDRRELIVPNKKFITEDVVNWTLSDTITRIVIPVGVSYECDPATARELLLQIAKDHPLVLAEPEPSAVFKSFGASTLDLELRAFLASRDDFPVLQNELNTKIRRVFAENGIEIAFAQQDIRIRSIDAAGLHSGSSLESLGEATEVAADRPVDDSLRKSA